MVSGFGFLNNKLDMEPTIWYTMSMDLTGYFKTTVRKLVERTRGTNAWLSIGYQTYELIEKLAPSTPDDCISGFIAYSVSNDKRMKIKTSRFLGKKLKLNTGFISEKDLQHFTDQINENLFPKLTIELVTGSAIMDCYRDDIGGQSCMTGYDCEKVGMYSSNTSIYCLLTMYSGNSNARAMVIKLDNGSFLMDRVYSDSSYLEDQMFFHAQKQGWYYRTYTGAGDYQISLNGGQITDYSDMTVSNVKYEDGQVPYADTLTQYENCGDTLNILHEQANGCCDGILGDTDGYIIGGDYSTCEDCEERIPDDDMNYVDQRMICGDCYTKHCFYCNYCETSHYDDDGHHVESMSATVCLTCLSQHFYCCDDCGDYHTEGEVNFTDEGCVCCHCYDGNYFTCEQCETVTENAERKEGSDGELYCETCIEDHLDNDNDGAAIEHQERVARADIAGQAVMDFVHGWEHND